MSREPNPFVPLAQEYADQARAHLIGGWKVVGTDTTLQQTKGAKPSPLARPTCAQCQDDMSCVAQFWHGDRLWSVHFCACDEANIHVQSVAAGDGLTVGEMIAGNNAWRLEPNLYLPNLDTLGWAALEDLMELKAIISPLDMWDFHEALTSVLDCDNYKMVTHFDGQASWVQNDETPHCPACQNTMSLLVQVESPHFYWGDSGALYVFACPQHPEQTWATAQMC